MGVAAVTEDQPCAPPGKKQGFSSLEDPGQMLDESATTALLSHTSATEFPWNGGQAVPTWRGIDSSPALFLWESRTTNVDVMSVSNTTRPVVVSR